MGSLEPRITEGPARTPAPAQDGGPTSKGGWPTRFSNGSGQAHLDGRPFADVLGVDAMTPPRVFPWYWHALHPSIGLDRLLEPGRFSRSHHFQRGRGLSRLRCSADRRRPDRRWPQQQLREFPPRGPGRRQFRPPRIHSQLRNPDRQTWGMHPQARSCP